MLPHFLEIWVGSRYFTFFYSVIMLYFLSPAVVPIRSEMKEVNTYPHMQEQAHTRKTEIREAVISWTGI